MKIYKNNFLNEIVYPIGGIGTGSIGISGDGCIVDPEFFGRPNRESLFGNTGIFVKAEQNGKVIDWRKLSGDSDKNLSGILFDDFGNGKSRGGYGFRHFSNTSFTSKFPFVNLKFNDNHFPADISFESYNPFIPSDDMNSSIPVAVFNFKFKNTTNHKTKYTVAFCLSALEGNRGKVIDKKIGDLTVLTLTGSEEKNKNDISISTDNDDVAIQHYWDRGAWFAPKTMFMNDFSKSGKIADRVYDTLEFGDTGVLTASVEIEAHCVKEIHFYLGWYIPKIKAYWEKGKPLIKQYYAKNFIDSIDVVNYYYKNKARLYSQTKAFSDCLFSSTLPKSVLECINRNLCILKSSTCLRLYDGSFWAWEGVFRKEGSCMGTCQHVWGYVNALAFLFPKLSKGVRTNELKNSLEDNGLLHFRMPITRNYKWNTFACVDGQMGEVFKCFREWRLSGDTKWLKTQWQKIKKILEYAWSKENTHRWDIDKTGVISGRQHHTLDLELFGVNSWLTGYYLLALNCASIMADFLGETDKANEYRNLYIEGKDKLDKITFNGKYYVQNVDISSPDVLSDYFENAKDNLYWDEHSKQIKYQIANGCGIDQVVVDMHAHILGVESMYYFEHKKSALQYIYDNNFISMREHNNPCRVFAANGEKGTVMVSFPNDKPNLPILYAEEFMAGFEYSFAINLIICGLEKQALEIVESINDRYDGKKRNPFAEIECGASYSRSLACYSFLPVYSGFYFDLPNKTIGFNPYNSGKFFWSADNVWGQVIIDEQKVEIKVLYGEIELKQFIIKSFIPREIQFNRENIDFIYNDGIVKFKNSLKLKARHKMQFRI